MTVVRRLTLLSLACVLLACGDDDDTPPRPTPTTVVATATAPATATVPATAASTRTATPVPATATRTVIPTDSPTVTTTPTASVGAVALFSADPDNPANPFPSDRLLDETGHVALRSERLASIVPADARYDATRAYLASSCSVVEAR